MAPPFMAACAACCSFHRVRAGAGADGGGGGGQPALTKPHTASFELRDARWARWTCPLGWHVIGIWGSDGDRQKWGDAVSRVRVAASMEHCVVAVSLGLKDRTDAGITLFRYPTASGAPARRVAKRCDPHSGVLGGLAFSG